MRAGILWIATAVILLIAGNARGVTFDEEGRVVFSEAEKAVCKAEGGCTIVTAAWLAKLAGKCEKPKTRAPRKDEV